MQPGALTGQYDAALLAVDVFFILFVLLVLHLRREDRRDGYPLIRDKSSNPRWQSFDFLPKPKTFIMPHGGEITLPRARMRTPYVLHADTSGIFQGLPIVPTGNPMVDGVGPAAYAMRHDMPELGFDDAKPRIVPLRLLADFYVATADPDPRGWPVLGADGVVAGPVRDVWVDRSEVVIRYIEVDAPGRRVLVPMPLTRINRKAKTVKGDGRSWRIISRKPP